MDGGENPGFKGTLTTEGKALLQVRVNEKLRELMGDYSDDTLAEYATVLLKNGRTRDEVAKELHVFLGDDNDAFVSWLWDHLSSNSHLYFHPKAVSSNDGAKSTRSAARGLPVPSLTSSIQTNLEAETQNTPRTHQKREWGGIIRDQAEAVPHRSVVAKVSYEEEKAFHESRADDKRFHKSHSLRRAHSPDRHNQRKRSREVDERPAKRASHPVIDAPRRLLQFAVRDAVRPVQPMISRSESASKRLRSVVSTLASDSTIDDSHVRLRRAHSDLRVPGAARALRAAAEAAEDVLNNNFSGSVFNRLGGVSTINSTEKSPVHREQDSDDGEYENAYNMQAENQAEFRKRNEYGGGDAYMYDRETEEAAGSAPNIIEYGNASAVRYNGLVSHRNTESPSGDKESLVVGYARGAAEVRSRRLMVQGTHAGSGPRSSEKILNASANTSTRHETRDAATLAPQVPVEKKGIDARKPNKAVSNVNDATMTDKSKDLMHSNSMLEAQRDSSVAAGSGSTGQPEGGNDSRTVFISNVHFGASKDALSRHFNKFGAVLKTLILTDGVTGQPTGSAYIEFLHKESAEQALTLNGTSFMSRILKVVRSSVEVPQQSVWPRASRGSPFASRLIRTAYPRPTFPGAIRGRLPLRGGTRSLQWKREAADSPDAGKPSQATPAAHGNQLVTPTARSFTYTRTEPKPNDGAMV
ncbi:hypothetical protein EJB05_39158 [Eragrostis curvula]|uniref:RRM domain-containing protein n=1 Tax=Eragrostis curvula TaxID=38414 RepID=A0A5J9TXS3_9POAL|nr:hypothetical protein EJB05_39158 [Eragrostis curvula]